MYKAPRDPSSSKRTAGAFVHLTDEEKKRLEADAKACDTNAGWVIRQALLARWGIK